jgi:phosphoribosylaminoimidazolecarboxamide formyltransferase/IMP cyclohydrolase
VTRALLSVSDKTGLVEFARTLEARGVELISTGGTATHLRSAGFTVIDVSALTLMPEMLDGRVKTLHPAIHGGLLAQRDLPDHMATLATHGIGLIDILVVTLYPFEQTLASGASRDEIIEQIDIGGPAMIRSAAKNGDHVTVIVDPADYAKVSASLDEKSTVPHALRRTLAAKAFARTASYDAAIAAWLAREEADFPFPAYLLGATQRQSLRYGENAHQRAAVYHYDTGIAGAIMHQGKELSYNNFNDSSAAWELVQEFTAPAVALIKHANPCGVAIAGDVVQAFTKALACDPQSAYGGILATNCPLTADLVRALGSLFLEVIIAPEIEAEALTLLAAKKNLRVLSVAQNAATQQSPLAALRISSISGGLLLQTRDDTLLGEDALRTVTQRTATPQQLEDLRFAFAVAKHVKSNAIVIAKDGATIGIGAGQMSRIDSVRIACDKARAAGLSTTGAVLASDAFFPFADNVDASHAAGVDAVIQPGGSLRDPEVIAAANAAGMVMVFAGMRHFRH